MKVVTVLTDLLHPQFINFLKPSCEYFNLELHILPYENLYSTHRLKDTLLFKFLKELKKDDIILFSDGHDAFFLSDESEIMEKFKIFQTNLVFSAEINCWPDPELEKTYPDSHTKFRFLNSGAFIGYAGFILELFEQYPFFSKGVDSPFYWSNQYYWHQVFLKNQDNITLDYRCEIFFNTASPWKIIKRINSDKITNQEVRRILINEIERFDRELLFQDSRIISKISRTKPSHVHFPGPIGQLIAKKGYFDKIKTWEKL